MKPKEISEFLAQREDDLPCLRGKGMRFRASATMTDGTFLPCVVIESEAPTIDLAIKRFEDEKEKKSYRSIVGSFVTGGNRLNHYDIKELKESDFSIPKERLSEIGGETSMGWTEFYATMSDGNEFRFGTTFHTEFFEMPDGYKASDITSIEPAKRGEKPKIETIYRERPFFTCFIATD